MWLMITHQYPNFSGGLAKLPLKLRHVFVVILSLCMDAIINQYLNHNAGLANEISFSKKKKTWDGGTQRHYF